MFCIWEHKGNEYRKQKNSFTLKLSSHALERMNKREVVKDAVLAVANFFAATKELRRHATGDRIAIRSEEGMIIVFGLGKINTYRDFLLCICTVWNTKDGEFHFRKGMKVYDFALTRSGVSLTEADENTISRQEKYVFE